MAHRNTTWLLAQLRDLTNRIGEGDNLMNTLNHGRDGLVAKR